MPQIGSTSWPRARPTLMVSAARWMATRRTPSRVRTSAEPRPERPARPLAMQLTESFDQRSPQRLVVTLVGATSHMILASRSARSVTVPSCSPILKPIWPRSVRMAWPGSYMPAPMVMTAAQAPLAPGRGGHPLVVDAVLEVDDDAVGLLQVLEAEGHRPLRVVGLHGDEDGVERLGHRLQLVELQRAHRNQVLAAGAREPEPDLLHGLDVLRPLVDQASRHDRPWSASRPPRCRSPPPR